MSLRFFRRSPSKPQEEGHTTKDVAAEEQAAYERRRNQVRRAQRNHRERKANYIKALEEEVVNLRKQNQHNIFLLENEINLAHGMLASHGITPPARQSKPLGDSDTENMPSFYTVTKPDGLKSPLQLILPDFMHVSASPNARSRTRDQTDHSGSPFSSGTDTEHASQRRNRATAALGKVSGSVHEDHSQGTVDKIYGIDFVLSLEHPCMAHPDMTRDQYGTHSHMATYSLLQHAPPGLQGANSWEVPGANIERLLELSTNFSLQGEITPVQAWYQLKQHHRYNELSAAQVQRLKNFLVNEVKCYGFGSVMDEQIWAIAIDEVLNRP